MTKEERKKKKKTEERREKKEMIKNNTDQRTALCHTTIIGKRYKRKQNAITQIKGKQYYINPSEHIGIDHTSID